MMLALLAAASVAVASPPDRIENPSWSLFRINLELCASKYRQAAATGRPEVIANYIDAISRNRDQRAAEACYAYLRGIQDAGDAKRAKKAAK